MTEIVLAFAIICLVASSVIHTRQLYRLACRVRDLEARLARQTAPAAPVFDVQRFNAEMERFAESVRRTAAAFSELEPPGVKPPGS